MNHRKEFNLDANASYIKVMQDIGSVVVGQNAERDVTLAELRPAIGQPHYDALVAAAAEKLKSYVTAISIVRSPRMNKGPLLHALGGSAVPEYLSADGIVDAVERYVGDHAREIYNSTLPVAAMQARNPQAHGRVNTDPFSGISSGPGLSRRGF